MKLQIGSNRKKSYLKGRGVISSPTGKNGVKGDKSAVRTSLIALGVDESSKNIADGSEKRSKRTKGGQLQLVDWHRGERSNTEVESRPDEGQSKPTQRTGLHREPSLRMKDLSLDDADDGNTETSEEEKDRSDARHLDTSSNSIEREPNKTSVRSNLANGGVRKGCVRFSDAVDAKEISRLNESAVDDLFYNSTDLAEMRYSAFMFECGLEEVDE